MTDALAVDALDVDVDFDGVLILRGLALHTPAGSFVALVGPNGSGKSTLLRTMARILRPQAGAVWVGSHDVWDLTARQSAQRTAMVTQEMPTEFTLDVEETVALGRTPHHGWLSHDSSADRRIVRDALTTVGMLEHSDRNFCTLSGGEKQRVLVARALAQQPRVLLLDEPTNHLDVAAQFELLELVGGLGVTVIAALHDLNLAAAHCDSVVVLRSGRLVAAGPPDEVLDESLVAAVYGVRAHCGIHPLTGRLLLAFASGPAPSKTQQQDKESVH